MGDTGCTAFAAALASLTELRGLYLSYLLPLRPFARLSRAASLSPPSIRARLPGPPAMPLHRRSRFDSKRAPAGPSSPAPRMQKSVPCVCVCVCVRARARPGPKKRRRRRRCGGASRTRAAGTPPQWKRHDRGRRQGRRCRPPLPRRPLQPRPQAL